LRTRLVKIRGLAWKTAIPVACLAVAGQLALAGGASAAPSAASARLAATPKNMLNCNSTVLERLCTDPHSVYDGKASRFIDAQTGAYVGHDEPSVKFISSRPGSGNTFAYGMQLPVDPARSPTASGSVVDYGELSVAPWFGMPVCDPQSYPQNPCTPLSDSNTGTGLTTDAGSAFMELQLYPPGFTPWLDSESCSATQWCAALTIDSLECNFNFATCNNGCEEPLNFSWLQTNGVPTGPPGPSDPTAATFTPNGSTLMMNPGDALRLSVSNVQDSGSPDRGGIKASITDVTTGQTGFVVASAANGFQNTSISNCAGTPFSFHAEYNTAKKQNQVPWAALEGGILMEQEIGHGETCSSLTHKLGFSETFGDGSSYTDPNVFQTCNGGSEGKNATGEGPCNATTGVCQNATTQGVNGPVACPSDSLSSGDLCEFSDAYCFPNGSRTATLDGSAVTESSRLNFCFQDAFQNGDLDYDGTGYVADWPNGSPNLPTSMRYIGPFTNGHTYPNIQFETDAPGSESLCDVTTGTDCTAPPLGSEFYPFWTLTNQQSLGGHGGGACVWNFGNVNPGVTTNDFGKDAQYGTPDVARYGGTLTSAVMANPEFTKNCGAA
jgi:hypothetical protein